MPLVQPPSDVAELHWLVLRGAGVRSDGAVNTERMGMAAGAVVPSEAERTQKTKPELSWIQAWELAEALAERNRLVYLSYDEFEGHA